MPGDSGEALGTRQEITPLAVIAAAVVSLAVVTPAFTGSDEPGHFARVWRITEGRLMPDPSPSGEALGACLPRVVLHEAVRLGVDGLGGRPPSDSELAHRYESCGGDRAFVDTSTFAWYSPLGYLPAAAGLAVGRTLALPLGSALVLARLSNALVCLLVLHRTLVRVPRGRWAVAAVVSLPVATFTLASVSPDGMTLALACYVVSGALRRGVTRGRQAARIFFSSLALGLTKPGYVVLSLAHLLPAVGRARRHQDASAHGRESRVVRGADQKPGRPAPLTPGAGLSLPASTLMVGLAVVSSTLWYVASRDDFRCDVWMFGTAADPAGQLRRLLHEPWVVVAAGAVALRDHGVDWLSQSGGFAERVAPTLTRRGAAAAVVGALVVAAWLGDRDRSPGGDGSQRIRWTWRVSLAGLAAAGYLGIVAGWLVYCSPPGLQLVSVPHVRVLTPVLVPLMLGALVASRPRPSRGSVIPVVLLTCVQVLFVADVVTSTRLGW